MIRFVCRLGFVLPALVALAGCVYTHSFDLPPLETPRSTSAVSPSAYYALGPYYGSGSSYGYGPYRGSGFYDPGFAYGHDPRLGYGGYRYQPPFGYPGYRYDPGYPYGLAGDPFYYVPGAARPYVPYVAPTCADANRNGRCDANRHDRRRGQDADDRRGRGDGNDDRRRDARNDQVVDQHWIDRLRNLERREPPGVARRSAGNGPTTSAPALSQPGPAGDTSSPQLSQPRPVIAVPAPRSAREPATRPNPVARPDVGRDIGQAGRATPRSPRAGGSPGQPYR